MPGRKHDFKKGNKKGNPVTFQKEKQPTEKTTVNKEDRSQRKKSCENKIFK